MNLVTDLLHLCVKITNLQTILMHNQTNMISNVIELIQSEYSKPLSSNKEIIFGNIVNKGFLVEMS